MKIKPIKTRYNGYLFRSRAEARWAVLFDELNIKYIYEPEGYELSDGTRYLPDFYLPEIKTYFEVKPEPGRITDYERQKIHQFLQDLEPRFCIGYSDMTFQTNAGWEDYGTWPETVEESMLCECYSCKHRCFLTMTGGWECPYCGEVGDNFKWLALGDEPDHSAFKKARAAQFEFTEGT